MKQSFAHGRTKTVVVETKRKRMGDDKPAAAEAKPAAFQSQPKVAQGASQTATQQRPQAPSGGAGRSGVVLRTLTAEEKEARDRALSDARVREAEERKRQEEEARRRSELDERERNEREAAARRKAEDDARHRVEEEGRRKAEEAAKKLAPKTPAGVVTPATVPMKPSTVTAKRPVNDDDDGPRTARSGGPAKRELKAPVPTRTKTDADKRRGRLTVVNALNEEEASAPVRSPPSAAAPSASRSRPRASRCRPRR